jgi:hypothetical protein
MERRLVDNVEYAAAAGRDRNEAMRSLARAAGLPLSLILRLADRDELRSLFDRRGRLAFRGAPRTAREAAIRLEETRSRAAAPLDVDSSPPVGRPSPDRGAEPPP